MRPEEITLQSIQVKRPGQHPDLVTYRTATFRVLPADHPNSFVVPISVNLDSMVRARSTTRRAISRRR